MGSIRCVWPCLVRISFGFGHVIASNLLCALEPPGLYFERWFCRLEADEEYPVAVAALEERIPGMRTSLFLLPCFLMLCNIAGADPLPEHEALRKQANDAFMAGDYVTVIKVTTSIIEKNPADNTALYMRGSAQIEVGISRADAQTIRQGITDAREALTAASQPEFNYYLPYLYGMTNLTLIEGQVSHSEISVKIASELLEKATMTDEQKANVLYQRGLAYNAGKKPTEAVADFRSAIGSNAKHLAAYMAMADTYAESKLAEQAIQAYSEAIRAFPNEPLIHNNQGMFYQKIGRPNDALKSYTAALKIDPKYHIAMTNRGFTWLEGGRPAEAQNDFTASLKMEPRQIAVYSMRGTSLLVQGKWQEAIADYQTVMKMNPNDPIAHADAGFAHFFGRDYEGALTEFNSEPASLTRGELGH